jgi:hypothetical protein
MKRNRRRLPIPQHEFGFVPDTFTLIRETGLDGDRLAREHAEAEQSRQRAEAAQAKLFVKRRHKRLLRRAA